MPHARAFLALSLDGYIAGPGDALDWLDAYQGAEDTFTPYLAEIGALLMGRRTYDVVRSFGGPWPYGERPVLVATHRPLPSPPPGVDGIEAVEGPIEALIAQGLERAGGRDLYVDGGALIRDALRADRLDALTITLAPTVLGGGVPLFVGPGPPQRLAFEGCRALGRGLVELRYRRA